MYNQQNMQVTEEARNPASCVTAGIASMPAPTCFKRTEIFANLNIRGGGGPRQQEVEGAEIPSCQQLTGQHRGGSLSTMISWIKPSQLHLSD